MGSPYRSSTGQWVGEGTVEKLQGDPPFRPVDLFSHNLWTSKGRNFQGEELGDLFESDLHKIFVGPDNHDYRLC